MINAPQKKKSKISTVINMPHEQQGKINTIIKTYHRKGTVK